jgi:hypothetical protein
MLDAHGAFSSLALDATASMMEFNASYIGVVEFWIER